MCPPTSAKALTWLVLHHEELEVAARALGRCRAGARRAPSRTRRPRGRRGTGGSSRISRITRLPMVRSCDSESEEVEASPRSGRPCAEAARRDGEQGGRRGGGGSRCGGGLGASCYYDGRVQVRFIMTEKFTHFDAARAGADGGRRRQGRDASRGRRRGIASACSPRRSSMVMAGTAKKGDVLGVARIAAHPGRQAHLRADPALPPGAAHLGRRSSSRPTSAGLGDRVPRHAWSARRAPASRWRRSPR